MKKLLFVIMALFAISISANAKFVTVHFKAGHTVEGDLRYHDDTTIVMKPYYYGDGKVLTIRPEEVNDLTISGLGRFCVQDGKFVPDAKTQAKMEAKQTKVKEQLEQGHYFATDPNKVIGRALKSTGAACIGVGIPSLLVGTILVTYGTTGLIPLPKTTEEANKNLTKSRCATAGCVILPFGAALTIVGVPLHVHGKRIAELKFNYTGNGAGVSVDF